MKKTVVITDYGFPDVAIEQAMLEGQGWDVVAAHCRTEDEVVGITARADAVMVQWAPLTRKGIGRLENGRIIVRYGIGLDNVDLAAAAEHGRASRHSPSCSDEAAPAASIPKRTYPSAKPSCGVST